MESERNFLNKEHLSPRTPEAEERRDFDKQVKEVFIDADSIYGQAFLESYDLEKKGARSSLTHEQIENYKKYLSENFERSKASILADLHEKAEKHRIAPLLRQTFERMSKKDIQNIARRENFSARLDARTLAIRLTAKLQKTPDKVSSDTLVEIFRVHGEYVQQVKEQWLEKIQREYLPRFKISIAEMIKDGTLPLDEKVIDERLRTLSFMVLDNFIATLQDRGGDYTASSNSIRLSVESLRFGYAVFVHEMLHALSGQTDEVEKLPETAREFLEEDDGDFRVPRVGLRFFQRKNDGENEVYSPVRLRWLNEAVTEKLTVDVVTHSEAGLQEAKEQQKRIRSAFSIITKMVLSDEDIDIFVYPLERLLLEKLVNLGLPEEIVLQAYFENYRDQAQGHTTPKLQALFQETNRLFGKGFLVKLDMFIRKNGIKKTLEECGNRGNDFPNFIHNAPSEDK